MKHGNGYWAILLALLAAPALAANKCVEASGRIFYQAAPCPANTRGGDMQLNVNRPFAALVQYNYCNKYLNLLNYQPTRLNMDGGS